MPGWAVVWRWRSSLIYTVGCWTLVGCAFYYSGGRVTARPVVQQIRPAGGSPNSEDDLKSADLQNAPGKQVSFLSTMIYKPEFVPYSVRLQSFLDENSDKGK